MTTTVEVPTNNDCSKDYRPSLPGRAIRPEDFRPDSYILHIQETVCDHCGATSTHSRAFLVKVHDFSTARTGARILVPATSVNPNLPIGTSRLSRKTQPFCHLCYETMPKAEKRPPISERDWALALRAANERERAAREAAVRKAEREANRVNIMDLPL